MASSGPMSVILIILNVLHVVFGLALTCVGFWFFIEIKTITNLRNANHYLLDYNVYWPQAIPWVFIIVGVLVMCVSCCGFVGAKKKSSGMIGLYIAFELMAICALIAAAVIALVFADSKSTDKFINDAIWDVYTTMKDDKSLEESFGVMEKRLQCCGASSPRDYVNWRDEFPMSCCDTYYHGWVGTYNIICDRTNKLANDRHGCSEVVTNYTRIIIRVLSGAAIVTAFIGITNIIVSTALFKGLKRKPQRLPGPQESDSKKVLL